MTNHILEGGNEISGMKFKRCRRGKGIQFIYKIVTKKMIYSMVSYGIIVLNSVYLCFL